jgi:hypothetical protein
VKCISARTALIALLFGLAVVAQAQPQDYYVYQTSNGTLAILSQKPPPGSIVIKKLNLPEDDQAQESGSQPNGPTESSPKQSKGK